MTGEMHNTSDHVLVNAPLDVVRDLVLDVEGWPQLHRPAVHAEILERHPGEELIRHWSLVDDRTVRTWVARRWWENDRRRLVFAHEPARSPLADVRGSLTFERRAGGVTLVRMDHEFRLESEEGDAARRTAGNMARGAREYLETLRYAAENRDELERLIISFEDPLFTAGSVEDAYAYLYEADKWPERIPHVKALKLEEPEPGVQFFDMDTLSSDGSEHTTRSVRICLPHRKIVYKQIRPPKTMDAHTGHWLFTETPEGIVVSARHTATIRPEGLHLLGEGTTVERARRYLRRVLSANSMGNLRLAKEYAEQHAGW
ncbi:aromatase/cyclase [Actinomadura kijaniata]|uniref:aromatase/cyclase n=1 Tax=Actinomadura kijaniata TaxID=46161 RepID=UPI003F1E0DE5